MASAESIAPSRGDPTELAGYRFQRPELLSEALTHPSALPALNRGTRRRRRVPPGSSYERLEFLGDRVLGLVIAELLWRRFEHEPEGHLTRRLTHLVRREALARVAGEIGLAPYLKMSAAEVTAGAAQHPGILADVMEAVIAAIYIDGGFPEAQAFIIRLWEPMLTEMAAPPRDPKTSLQEWVQGRGLPLPAYELVDTSGPDHAPLFTIAVRVSGHEEATGTASSKRGAELAAAAALLGRIGVPT
ncbi:MAG: ribonuclease III [Alphaproteobacteria bacterium]|nr:ribonuclease III [Alphaproteobacteria bacterium]